jgi:hypothetical protein
VVISPATIRTAVMLDTIKTQAMDRIRVTIRVTIRVITRATTRATFRVDEEGTAAITRVVATMAEAGMASSSGASAAGGGNW